MFETNQYLINIITNFMIVNYEHLWIWDLIGRTSFVLDSESSHLEFNYWSKGQTHVLLFNLQTER